MTLPLFPVRRLAFALAATAALSACGGDGPVPPPPSPSQIAPAAGTNNQETAPGATLPAPTSVRVTASTGEAVPGVTVTWQVTSGGGSVSPATSVTNQNGIAQTQWTLGPTAGVQTVSASIGTASTTIVAIASSIEPCSGALNLEVGQVCLATPAQAANISVQGGASGGEFVAIPYYDGNFSRTAIQLSAAASGVVPVVGPPSPSIAPSFSVVALGPATSEITRDFTFEQRLRAREREQLGRLIGRHGGSGAEVAASFSMQPPAPRFAVGSVRTINVSPADLPGQEACTHVENRQAIVRHESANAVLMEDLQNPSGGFTQQDWAEIGQFFDQHIWPLGTATFGEPTDIDNNARVIILYTARVNQMNLPGASTIIGGFFFARDIFRKTEVTTPNGTLLRACTASNEAEIFFVLAPDPNGTINGNRQSTADVKLTTLATIAHELQHLINASRRFWINPPPAQFERVWMEEGLSHAAEELLYYRLTGFSPRENLDSSRVAQSTVADAFNRFMSPNFARFRRYLQATATQSAYDEHDDVETRGATWSFLRWAVDRQANENAIWWLLVNNGAVGENNLRAVFGNNVGNRFREWAAAHYLDDVHSNFRPPSILPVHHPSWDFRSVFRAILGGTSAYPLNTRQLTNAAAANITLVDGGAMYFRFGVGPNSTATVNFTSGGGQLPSGASVWVARTK